MKIKTVAIIGAGAIGSYFIAGLTEKPEILERMQKWNLVLER